MNEYAWLDSGDAVGMLEWYLAPGGFADGNKGKMPPGRLSDRKLRLFACAVVRIFWAELTERMRKVILVAEDMADDKAGDDDYYKASHEECIAPLGTQRELDLRVMIHKCAMNLSWGGAFIANGTVEHAVYLSRGVETRRRIADILRDIVGNPWRPVRIVGPTEIAIGPMGTTPLAFHSEWLTPPVRAIAQAAYEDRNPDGTLQASHLLPLSDALEDARCTGEDILLHLRGERMQIEESTVGNFGLFPQRLRRWVKPHVTPTHYRGCHVIDLILGLE